MMASITKVGKVWRYRIYYYEGDTRKCISKSGFSSKRECTDEAILREHELLTLQNHNKATTPLADYMDYWKTLYKEGTVSAGTLQRYNCIIEYVRNNYNITIKDVTIDNYQAFLNELSFKRSPATVKKYHDAIRQALEHAVDTGIISRLPIKKAIIKGDKAREKKKEHKFISFEQFKQLETALLDGLQPDYTSRYLILFAMATGCRCGECLGLFWDDIDFNKRTITIKRSYNHARKTYTDGKTTNAQRVITVPKKLLDLLETLPHNDERVFPSVSNNALNKTLGKFLDKIGCNVDMTFHGLRHTHASILLSQGVNILSVSKRLGHADTTETLKTYAHIIRELEAKDNEFIASILDY